MGETPSAPIGVSFIETEYQARGRSKAGTWPSSSQEARWEEGPFDPGSTRGEKLVPGISEEEAGTFIALFLVTVYSENT